MTLVSPPRGRSRSGRETRGAGRRAAIHRGEVEPGLAHRRHALAGGELLQLRLRPHRNSCSRVRCPTAKTASFSRASAIASAFDASSRPTVRILITSACAARATKSDAGPSQRPMWACVSTTRVSLGAASDRAARTSRAAAAPMRSKRGEPVVGDRLPACGALRTGAPGRIPRVLVERSHPHAHHVRVVGAGREQVPAALGAERLRPAVTRIPVANGFRAAHEAKRAGHGNRETAALRRASAALAALRSGRGGRRPGLRYLEANSGRRRNRR